MLRKLFSGDASRHAELVELAYRTVLQRAPDAEGLATYTAQLATGQLDAAGLLKALSDSPEFAALTSRLAGDTRGVTAAPALTPPALTPPALPAIALTPMQQALSSALAASTAIDWASYTARWRELFENPAYPLIIGQQDYGRIHQRRFFETLNALALLGAEREGTRILEFGASDFSALYRQFFPQATLAIADRPVPEDYIGFTAEVALNKLGASDWHTVDLQAPEQFASLTAALPRYTHLLFCEVLEHLVVNPVELLRFLLSLLTEDGVLYLTTPNFFRRENLQKIQQHANPQAVYPASGGNWDAHFHHREFAVRELLDFADQAGAVIRACCFSACWDPVGTVAGSDETLGNIVLVLARAD